ncbi:MAG: VOC family protein [Thermoleophilia bacterium]|nr:VOC family protein [Thermoleophilia bacterium]MDH4338963.1 VOC family protein [Thermoleophilia bacterium]MDH5280380.1 VOC family protein [Thermoleophilia bacterium]
MERVTGIGGVFFRARDPKTLLAWYREILGAPVGNEDLVIFPESRNTHWVPFPSDTTYWPAERELMVNYTVGDLDAMLEQLRRAGVTVDEHVEEHEFGRFGWCWDPEGNRVELWEPPEGPLPVP